MIFNFYIEHSSGATDFGACSADSIEEATQLIKDRYGYYDAGEEGFKKPVRLNVEHGIEDLINEQYGGFAILTTGAS
jgi:hypothetical protein